MTETRTRLLLIRHGQTPWNEDGRWQGHGNPGLTEEGLAQAKALALTLAEERQRWQRLEPKQGAWTRVFSSDLERARQTALTVADHLGLPIEFDRRLRELDVGVWSGLTRDEIARRDPDRLRRFELGEPFIRPGDGESRVEIRERTHALVSDFARRFAGDRIILVTHLGVIRSLVPGAEPGNVGRIEIVAEELAARPVDRSQRAEDGAL
jgi:broad specificity phosphatase PhoE